MKSEMKSRVIVLGILAIIAIATGFGYAAIASSTPIGLVISQDKETSELTILVEKDGRTVLTALNASIEGITVLIPPEPAQTIEVKAEKLTEEEEAKAVEIALNDPRVKEIIEGKEYEIDVGPIIEITESGEGRKAGAHVTILIPEEATYGVFISLEKEEVFRIISLPPLKPKSPE